MWEKLTLEINKRHFISPNYTKYFYVHKWKTRLKEEHRDSNQSPDAERWQHTCVTAMSSPSFGNPECPQADLSMSLPFQL